MASKLILVAIDQSQQSEEAFKYYLETLHNGSHKVMFVHIVELPANFDEARHSSLSRGTIMELWHAEESKCKAIFDKYRALAKGKQVPIADCILEKGLKPGHMICEIAKEKHACAVVMGTRGFGTLRRTIMGSVSDHVLYHAHCPVVICRK